MSDLYWLTDEQMARLAPYFPNRTVRRKTGTTCLGRRWRDGRFLRASRRKA